MTITTAMTSVPRRGNPGEEGGFLAYAGNVPHTMRAGPQGALVLDIFSPPRPEYKKPGSGFGRS